MRLIISEQVFDNFEDLVIGVVLAKGIDNKTDSPEVKTLLLSVQNDLENRFVGLESPSQHQNIIPWRQAYKKFGADPHDYRCSSEALTRRVLKGNKIGRINKLVDLYNYISLKYIIPVGGEDLDKIKGDLVLGFAKGDESFIRLGGLENEPPKPGEVVYKDETGVVCRRWNWREAERTKLTEETENAVIVIEGLPPISKNLIGEAIKELGELVSKYCGGSITTEILNKEKKEIVLI